MKIVPGHPESWCWFAGHSRFRPAADLGGCRCEVVRRSNPLDCRSETWRCSLLAWEKTLALKIVLDEHLEVGAQGACLRHQAVAFCVIVMLRNLVLETKNLAGRAQSRMNVWQAEDCGAL